MPVQTSGLMGLPAMGHALLDQRQAGGLFAAAGLPITSAAPEYVRFKPGENLLISYRFETDAGPTRGYTVTCVDPARAQVLFAKALAMRPRRSLVGAPVFRLDAHTVLYGFPNDARLRRLRWYVTPRKLKRTLGGMAAGRPSASRTDVAVLRYKPERRVVAGVTLGSAEGPVRQLFVRYSTRRQADHLARVAEGLISAGVQTPRPVAQLDEGRVSVDEFIAGEQLRDRVRAGGGDAQGVAASLMQFHNAPIPHGTPMRTIGDDLVRARVVLNDLGSWAPALASAIQDVVGALGRRPNQGDQSQKNQQQGLVHGDLHDKNIMVDRSKVQFVDLERVAVGSNATDLGCLRGTAIGLGTRSPGWSPGALSFVDEVIENYRSSGGELDSGALQTATGITLIDQAVLVSRHLASSWPDLAQTLLEQACHELR